MKSKLRMGISIGGPTIIMIFVVLCLTTLGTLSLVTANADMKLTQKTVESTAAYYAADALGEAFLADVDAAMNQNTANQNAAEVIGKLPDTKVTISAAGALFIAHSIKVNDAQKLLIELSIAVSSPSTTKPYKIHTWKVVNTDYWNYSDYEIQFNDTIPQN